MRIIDEILIWVPFYGLWHPWKMINSDRVYFLDYYHPVFGEVWLAYHVVISGFPIIYLFLYFTS